VKHLKETDSDQKEQLKVMTETVGTLAKSISDGFCSYKLFEPATSLSLAPHPS
jgi:hypothetical protein